jgi:Sulfotransferase family
MVTFAFLLGTGRCGSSLVHEILARHPDVGFVSNVDDRLAAFDLRGRGNRSIYRRVPTALTEKGRLRFAPSEGYRILGRRVSPALVDPVRDLVGDDATPWLAARFRRFFEDRADAQGAPIFLHKFTGWPRARFIHRVIPEARFVHVVRDGRAVANSLLQMPWWRGYRGPEAWGLGPLPDPYRREWASAGRSFAVLAGIEWKILIDAFEQTKAAVPAGQWLDVRYEDLVTDPGGSVDAILRFLGLGWTDEFERGFSRHALRSSRTDAYRQELSLDDVALLERSLAGHLEQLGYPTNVPSSEEASA